MTNLEVLYRIKQIVQQNKVWNGQGGRTTPCPNTTSSGIEDLVDNVFRAFLKRP